MKMLWSCFVRYSSSVEPLIADLKNSLRHSFSDNNVLSDHATGLNFALPSGNSERLALWSQIRFLLRSILWSLVYLIIFLVGGSHVPLCGLL